MMEEPEVRGSRLWVIAVGLAIYSIVLTAATGDIGFDADDWWIFSWAYWYDFPASVAVYAHEALRPIEGMYWLSLFQLVGFDRPVFHLFSLLLWVTASGLMGLALSQVFTRNRTFVILSMLFIFFLPTVSSLTYIIFTDNSRLSLVFFWSSVIAFQMWAKRSASLPGLALPLFLYILSFLTYEAPSLMIFAVPMFVLPIRRKQGYQFWERIFLVKLGAGILSAVVLAIAIRFFFLNGGAVEHRHLIPPLKLILSYLGLLPSYLVAPFITFCRELWVCVLAWAVGVWVAVQLYRSRSRPDEKNQPDELAKWDQGISYKIILGVAILFLGMLPYQIAGYGGGVPNLTDTLLAKWGIIAHGDTTWFNFNWASRIYSSASCGIAIILAAVFTAWKSVKARFVSQLAAVVVIVFMTAFHVGLSIDWKEAAGIRNDLVKSLVTQIPDVKPDTNFVFLDLESYHKRAAVVRRWMGLRELVRMLYDDRTLGAWYVYPYAWEPPNKIFQQAIAQAAGFVSRGMKLSAPAPHDSLLLLKRAGSKLVILDKIASGDGLAPTGISWRGVNSLRSNRNRILFSSSLMDGHWENARSRWIRGLVSTLKLSRVAR
jgi:hypothetical protein